MIEVAAELRARLARSGLKLGQVAVELGIDDSAVSRWLNGSRPMPPDFPERFETALRAVAKRQGEHLLTVAGEEAS